MSTKLLFEGLALEVDPSGYRRAKWEDATPFKVLASNLEAAMRRCDEALGPAKQGYQWRYKLLSFEEQYP